jgi:ComF family protein
MARSAGRYEGALRAIVHAFKYRGCRYLATPLGRRVREGAADLLDGADAVVPVPLHPWRAFRRGFNQSDDLARQLGRPVWRPLVRVRLGPPQAGVPAARRHANVRGAFRTTPIGPLLALGHGWTRRLAGRSVVLVDDVMTTGATLDACARVLRAAGVSDVRAVTVARAAAARL